MYVILTDWGRIISVVSPNSENRNRGVPKLYFLTILSLFKCNVIDSRSSTVRCLRQYSIIRLLRTLMLILNVALNASNMQRYDIIVIFDSTILSRLKFSAPIILTECLFYTTRG